MIRTFTSESDEITNIEMPKTEYRYAWFKNTGSTTVYISDKDTFAADEDGVIELPSGEASMMEYLTTKASNGDIYYVPKIYILGKGKVQIYETGSIDCPFEIASSGSESESGGGSLELSLSALASIVAVTDFEVPVVQLASLYSGDVSIITDTHITGIGEVENADTVEGSDELTTYLEESPITITDGDAFIGNEDADAYMFFTLTNGVIRGDAEHGVIDLEFGYKGTSLKEEIVSYPDGGIVDYVNINTCTVSVQSDGIIKVTCGIYISFVDEDAIAYEGDHTASFDFSITDSDEISALQTAFSDGTYYIWAKEN